MPADNPQRRAEEFSVISLPNFHLFAERLRDLGYTVVGPVVRDSAIVYDALNASGSLLTAGWKDEHGPGSYRITPSGDGALFGYAVGPLSLRRWLYPSDETFLEIRKDGDRFQVHAINGGGASYAFIGVRPCDVQAIDRLDRALRADPRYVTRRKRMFIAAVACAKPSANCFCVSAGGAPDSTPGCDLLFTEIVKPEHRFLVSAHSETGLEVLEAVPHRLADLSDIHAAQAIHQHARDSMRARPGVAGAAEALSQRIEDPRWEKIANRCLGCANCTMVCPTCFCTTVEDSSDVGGSTATRTRKWDSCFTQSFSYIHGGSVRQTRAARYRQWLMHKFAWWTEEFGITGCVGCGRCITWCPAAIDITDEIRALTGAAS